MSYKSRYGINTDVMWEDLRFPASAVRVGTARPASEQAYKGGIVLSFASGTDNSVYFNAQLPHGSKIGEDLDFHIHYILPVSGSGVGVENVKWDLTYSWSNLNGVFPAETTLSITSDVQNLVADTHYLLDLGDVLNANAAGSDGVSGMLICSLTRDTGVADNYGNAVYLAEADFHIKIDSLGSRQETVK